MEELVGTPFVSRGRTREGLDCWGLHRLAYHIETGLWLPSYVDEYADSAEAEVNARLIDDHLIEWQKVSSERRLDVVLMRVGRVPSHIGTVIRPGRMLHTYSGGAVRVEHYRSGLFKERIVGFYRYLGTA